MTNQLIEKIEVFKAETKKELHKKIREASSGPYKITDERVRRLGIFKKQYEVTAVITKQVSIADGRQDFAERLEEKILRERPKDAMLLKKEKLLEMLAAGAELAQSTPLLEEKKITQADFESLRAELAAANKQLSEKLYQERIASSGFVRFLKKIGIDSSYHPRFIKQVQKELGAVESLHEDDYLPWLRLAIEKSIPPYRPVILKQQRIISLIGQTGVGKTTTLVKLGWQLLEQGETVGFITTDTFRSGAVEQFQGYADKLEAELIVAKSPEELKEAIDYLTFVSGVDHILIDTVGRNYFDAETIAELDAYYQIIQPDLTCFVFNANSSTADIQLILGKLENIPIDGFIVTKLDETALLGNYYRFTQELTQPILWVTDGQTISEHIHMPSERWVTDRLLEKDHKGGNEL